MRVAMYYNNRDIRVEEMPVPPIGPGELLIRVQASGICGSDVMEWYRIHKAPLVLGHEIAGEVVAVGAGVERYHEGDRVSVAHHVPCNTCYYCLNDHHTVCDTLRQTNFDPGGFAEYLRLPAINVDRGVYRLPDEVSYEEGTFTEPLACVLRGQRVARIQPGQTVLVIGSGISGLLHLELARALGAGRLIATDVAEYRLEAARRFGAEAVIHAKEDVSAGVREVNNGRLADRRRPALGFSRLGRADRHRSWPVVARDARLARDQSGRESGAGRLSGLLRVPVLDHRRAPADLLGGKDGFDGRLERHRVVRHVPDQHPYAVHR